MGPEIQPPKGPESIEWFTYAWVLWISTVGGVVAFMRKMMKNRTKKFNLTEFIGECTTSAFAGVIAFWLCQWAEQSMNLHKSLTPAIVGLAGHMGSRFIVMMERRVAGKIENTNH